MDEIRESIEDLIEETCLRSLTDDQVERRIRRFTEICEQMISGRVENVRKRRMLLDRLEIMKCFYNHSPAQKFYSGTSAKEMNETERNKRLENIVRRRRMALQMIEKADVETARTIQELLEKEFNSGLDNGRYRPGTRSLAEGSEQVLSPHHWYFLYFNLLLLAGLLAAVVAVVR